MEIYVEEHWGYEEMPVSKSRAISEMRFLYLALNDEAAFEQAVLEKANRTSLPSAA